jgi:peptidylprolyl isomerase
MKQADCINTRQAACAVATVALLLLGNAFAAQPAAPAKLSYSEILATSKPSDWRALDPENTLYMDLPGGRVVIELSPEHVPLHAANIKALAREGYFNGLSIMRSQDNYVVQWGDPDEKNPRPIKTAKSKLAPEYTRKFAAGEAMPAFTRLPDVDGYAPQVGFSNGFPVGRNPQTREAWLTHCYGMVGAGRDNDDDSGSGAELYAVTGHAPRHLDRNIAVVGRVVQGMTLFSTLPRGPAPMGFYDKPEQRVPISAILIAADVPVADRTNLEVIRTDTPLFASLLEALRNRPGPWFKVPAGHVELCNIPIAVRPAAAK